MVGKRARVGRAGGGLYLKDIAKDGRVMHGKNHPPSVALINRHNVLQGTLSSDGSPARPCVLTSAVKQ